MAGTGRTLVLPNELLAHILSCLDTPPPSSSLVALRDEPRLDLTHSNIGHLKTVSVVSKLWRQHAIPLLFKHARFITPEPIFDKTKMDSKALRMQIQPFLDFVRVKSLKGIITTVTLVIEYFFTYYEPSMGKWIDRYSHFWISLFKEIDPEELVIVAPPAALDPLCACSIYRRMEHDCDPPYQYLRLQRPSMCPTLSSTPSISVGRNALESKEDTSMNTTLFNIRPWSAMLLNEGSSIKAYAIDDPEYEPPSILWELLGEVWDEGRIPLTVKDLEYIAIFPPLSHFDQIPNKLPKLDRLYVQLVPRNNILHNTVIMAGVEENDLWEERHVCYKALMPQLFDVTASENFHQLKVFESGDAADEGKWDLAVDYVAAERIPWHVVRDGVFEKNEEDEEPETDDDTIPS